MVAERGRLHVELEPRYNGGARLPACLLRPQAGWEACPTRKGTPMNDDTKNTLLWAAAGLGACLATRSLLRMARSMDLRGRVALITGGSRGLGLVLARELAGE